MRFSLFVKRLSLFLKRGSWVIDCIPPPRVDPGARACQLLKEAFPQLVAFPWSEQFEADIGHWASTSTQYASCSVEPETADDVRRILKIVGRSVIMPPFAIKGGGHASNVGHSSTTGVQISAVKFSGVEFDAENSTITIGTGLTWDQVYSRLEPLGAMVVGGRVIGVGVTGLSLGGGYSWKTDQFGSTIDTIVSHNVVLPSGQQVQASNTTNPDLFFGLRGGLNNFGIVTSITFEAHSPTLVFGGLITYALNVTEDVNEAVSNFEANNADPKAQILVEFTSTAAHITPRSQFTSGVIIFYDRPTPPPGLFDAFLSVYPAIDVCCSPDSSKFLFSLCIDVHHDVPLLSHPVRFLRMIVQEIISTEAELTQAQQREDGLGGGAYPHEAARPVKPSSPDITWEVDDGLSDEAQQALHTLIIHTVHALAHTPSNPPRSSSGQEAPSPTSFYPNYALGDTPLALIDLYGGPKF
ncbi:hypothetical protein ACEPAH_1585 [Sanghuangporus vaninii]